MSATADSSIIQKLHNKSCTVTSLLGSILITQNTTTGSYTVYTHTQIDIFFNSNISNDFTLSVLRFFRAAVMKITWQTRDDPSVYPSDV